MMLQYEHTLRNPKLVNVKGLACVRALLSNVSVATTLTDVELTVSVNIVKGCKKKIMFSCLAL